MRRGGIGAARGEAEDEFRIAASFAGAEPEESAN